MDPYKAIDVIKSHKFSTIYTGRGPNEVPVIIKKRCVKDTKNLDKFQREVEILKVLNHPGHPYILKLIDSGESSPFYSCLIFPRDSVYMTLTKLKSWFTIKKLQVIQIMLQLIDGLIYIHSKGVAHQDIKPKNIIWNGTHIKYIDYDLSCVVSSNDPNLKIQSSRVGTPSYLAPELWDKDISSKDRYKCDIYALGGVINYLCNGGHVLYPEAFTIDDQINLTKTSEPNIKTPIEPLTLLILSMIKKDPEQRETLVVCRTIIQQLEQSLKMIASIPKK